MGFSLFINYLAVSLLTWLGIYNAITVSVFFGLELVSLISLFRAGRIARTGSKTINDYYRLVSGFYSQLDFIQRFIFIFSSFLLLFFIALIPVSAGSTYYFTDALMHWSRWSAEWAAGRFPLNTNHYPQLLPANLSLIYEFTGETTYRLFPKIFITFFFLGHFLIFIDLALRDEFTLHLTGLIIYAFVILVFYSLLFILEVNADIPVSFFCFLTYYVIKQGENEKFNSRKILLAALFSASAADTKLAGTYFLGLTILWILYTLYSRRESIRGKDLIRICFYLILILAGSIFWYLVRPAEMVKGLDQAVYLPQGFDVRIRGAFKMLLLSMGIPFALFLILTVSLSIFEYESRLLILFIILPAAILWVLFFSYDNRNLSFILPFTSYASATGLQFLSRGFTGKKKKPIPKKFTKDNPGNRLIKPVLIFAVSSVLFVAAGSEYAYRLLIYLAYFFNHYIFLNYRILYMIELGYYNYAAYFLSAIRVGIAIFFILFLVRKMKVKIFHLILSAAMLAVLLNFTLLTREQILRTQLKDAEMVNIRNLYYRIYPSIIESGTRCILTTNDSCLAAMIPPFGATFARAEHINTGFLDRSVYGYDRYYYLLKKNGLDASVLDYIEKKISSGNISVCFNDGEVLFFKKK